MKVLIADDHPLVRDGMRHALARISRDVIVLDAPDYPVALKIIDNEEGLDLVLVDLVMPGIENFKGLHRLVERVGNIPVVVLTACEDRNDIRRALQCDVRGYIPKSSSSAVLLAALKLVLSGGAYVPPHLLEGDLTQQVTGQADASVLTRRQREVIALLSMGKSNKEISNELGLSTGTVRSHLEAIFKSLDVSNRTQACHVARELGLLDDDALRI